MYIFIMVLSAIIIFFAIFRTRHIVRSLFFSSLQGLVALFAVNFIGEFTGIRLALNFFSLSVCTVGGIPGVIFLLISNLLTFF